MSYSYDFCKKRCQEQNIELDWTDSYEQEAEPYFKNILQETFSFTCMSEELKWEQHISLEFNPEANFQYFTQSESIHDGTLLFITENIQKCINRIIMGDTWYQLPNYPQKPKKAKVHYTIGNFIIVNEFDKDGSKFTPKDKRWMNMRTKVMIPLICTWEPI